MTSLVRSSIIAGGILLLAGAQNVSAQLTDTVEFTTSFPFTVGPTTVPAGSYTIRPDDDDPRILDLTGAHTGVFFETDFVEARVAPSKTEVVFKRYGDGYVLKNVWVEGSTSGHESRTAERERHMARNESKGEQRIAASKRKKAIPTSASR